MTPTADPRSGHPAARTAFGAGEAVWVELCTEAPEAAADFYADLLGWSVRTERLGRGVYRMCSLEGRDVAGISDARALHAGRARGWITYFAVDDVERSARRATELGGELASGPRLLPDAGIGAVAIDPYGAAFGLFQARARAGVEALNVDGALCWNELDTGELAASVDFYRRLFGFDAGQRLSATQRPYTVLSAGEVPVAGVLELDSEWPNVLPSTWIAYFAVPRLAAAVERAVALGGRPSVGPIESPHGRLQLIRDGAGHSVALIELETGLRPSHFPTNPAVTR